MNHAALLYHLVWRTRNNEPMITAAVAHFLSRYLPAVGHQEKATILAMGIVSTHIHLLVRTAPTTGIPRLVQRFKGGSSRVAEIEGHSQRLHWANGYSITSVGTRDIPRVLEYLQSQPNRHASEAIPGWSGYITFIPIDTL